MDKTTTWLIRAAAAVVIVAGSATTIATLGTNGFFESFNEKIANLKNRISGKENVRETFTHKGKTYTASRFCESGTSMYWHYGGGFLNTGKVREIGCMSPRELEAYKRDMELGIRQRNKRNQQQLQNLQVKQNQQRLRQNQQRLRHRLNMEDIRRGGHGLKY